MKFGLFAPLGNPWATPEYLATLASGAEERGFDLESSSVKRLNWD